MGLIFSGHFFVGWLLIGIIYYFPRHKHRIFRFMAAMVCADVLILLYTLLDVNTRWIKIAHSPILFISFLIYHIICIPLILTLMQCVFHLSSKNIYKWLVFIISLPVFLAIDALELHFHIITFAKWNYFKDAGFYIGVIIISFGILYPYRKILDKRSHV